MRRSRSLTATGYGLAALLTLLPLLEPVVTLLPPQPGQIAWRLQAFGALSQSLPVPLAGLAVALVTAFLLQHRKTLRGLAVAALLGALLLTAAAALFVLDLLQYRGAVPAALEDYYRAAGAIYLTAFVLATLFLAWTGAAAWRAGRASQSFPTRRRRRSRGPARSEAGSSKPAGPSEPA